MIGLPAIEAFRPEPPPVDGIRAPAAHPHDPAFLDADVQAAAVGAKDTSRLDPSVGLFADPLVHPLRPVSAASKGCSVAPDVLDAVAALGHVSLRVLFKVNDACQDLFRRPLSWQIERNGRLLGPPPLNSWRVGEVHRKAVMDGRGSNRCVAL